MADIKVTTGVDTAGFRSGLARMYDDANRHARALKGVLGGAAVFAVGRHFFGQAISYIKEFAKTNEEAQASFERWEQVGRSFDAAVGQRLYHAGKFLEGVLLGRGATSAEFDAQQAQRDRTFNQIRSDRAMRDRLGVAELGVRATESRVVGDELGAELLGIEKAYQDSVRGLNITNATEKEKYVALLQRERDAEMELAKARAQRRADDAELLLMQKQRSLEADVGRSIARDEAVRQSLDGYEELARLTQMRLQYEEQIARVKSEYGIDDVARAELVAQLEGNRDATLLAAGNAAVRRLEGELRGAPPAIRTLEAGLGGFAGNFFGAGGFSAPASEEGQQQLIQELRRLKTELEAIRRNTAEGAAVAG